MNLLSSLLTASHSSEALIPAFLPPPNHLALIATLAIHPTLTIRAKSQKQIEVSNLALRYLRLILKVVGPVNSNLDEAFVFSGIGTSSRRGGSGRRRVIVEEASPTGGNPDDIENELAQNGALWTQVEDIWQVIGWAFNCSVLHYNRWASWRVWIEFMLDLFEEDWDARGLRLDQDAQADDDEEEDEPREKSMIVRSLMNAEGVTTGRERKIIRAIFADGGSRSVAEFPEIWRNETKERKKDGEAKKTTTKIDIEADNYGDYLDEDEDSDLEESDPDPSQNPSSKPSLQPPSPLPTAPTSDLATPLGGTAALTLRLRFLSLLSSVSFTLGAATFAPLNSLYDNYLEHIRPLPIPMFFSIISPFALRAFSPPAGSSLTQYILRSLITTAAPLPPGDDLTQPTLEKSYLPFAANTSSIVDNVKVSLCVETLLTLLDRHVGLVWTPALQDVVEAGIVARDTKATKVGKKRRKLAVGGGAGVSGVGDDEDEKKWLQASANRIRSVVLAAHV